MSTDLEFVVEAGRPITVRVKARGKRYVIRMPLGVNFVRDSGETDEQGLPKFLVNVGSTVHVEEEAPEAKP